MGAAASMQEFSSLTEKQQKELTAKFEALKADGKTEEEAVDIIKKLAQYRTIELTELLDVIGEIVAKGKTPLIVDNSEDDKVNTFYRYRTVQLIDGKKMGLDKSMKNVPVADIMEEKRKQLVTALKFGTPVIIALTKAVTDFVGTFNDASAAEKFNICPRAKGRSSRSTCSRVAANTCSNRSTWTSSSAPTTATKATPLPETRKTFTSP